MEHTYLLRPGRWRAEGTYYDETGRSFPLAGETELVQEGAERHLDGWMEVSGPAPVRFTNRYVIRETDRPFTLTWQSFNPVLGVLDRFLWLQFDELRILPDFGSGQPTVEDRVSCRVSAQALFIVLAAVRVLYEFWRKKVLDIFL